MAYVDLIIFQTPPSRPLRFPLPEAAAAALLATGGAVRPVPEPQRP